MDWVLRLSGALPTPADGPTHGLAPRSPAAPPPHSSGGGRVLPHARRPQRGHAGGRGPGGTVGGRGRLRRDPKRSCWARSRARRPPGGCAGACGRARGGPRASRRGDACARRPWGGLRGGSCAGRHPARPAEATHALGGPRASYGGRACAGRPPGVLRGGACARRSPGVLPGWRMCETACRYVSPGCRVLQGRARVVGSAIKGCRLMRGWWVCGLRRSGGYGGARTANGGFAPCPLASAGRGGINRAATRGSLSPGSRMSK